MDPIVRFKDIDVGEFFIVDDMLYIKTHPNSFIQGIDNAIDMSNGYPMEFGDNIKVCKRKVGR